MPSKITHPCSNPTNLTDHWKWSELQISWCGEREECSKIVLNKDAGDASGLAVLFSPSTASPGGSACVHAADLISACCPQCHQRRLPAVNKQLQQREELGGSELRGQECVLRSGMICVSWLTHLSVPHLLSYSTLSQLRLFLATTETLQRVREISETPPVSDSGTKDAMLWAVALFTSMSSSPS